MIEKVHLFGNRKIKNHITTSLPINTRVCTK